MTSSGMEKSPSHVLPGYAYSTCVNMGKPQLGQKMVTHSWRNKFSCLDFAGVQAGVHFLAGVQWRSLLDRYICFPNFNGYAVRSYIMDQLSRCKKVKRLATTKISLMVLFQHGNHTPFFPELGFRVREHADVVIFTGIHHQHPLSLGQGLDLSQV